MVLDGVGDGARLPPSFSHSWSWALCACFSLWRLLRNSDAKAAPPQAANNTIQRLSIFIITSITEQEFGRNSRCCRFGGAHGASSHPLASSGAHRPGHPEETDA